MKNNVSIAGLLVGLVLLGAVNLLGGAVLGRLRIDVTEEGLYSLSDGTRAILGELDEPIKLEFFFNEGEVEDEQAVIQYARRVEELLGEYVLASDGMLRLERMDPEPFSEAEDRAFRAGVAPVPLPDGSGSVYLGLVGSNTVGDEEVLPFFNPGRETLLEYELTNLVYTLANPERGKVAILTGLPVAGGGFNPMNPQAPGAPPWQIVAQLEKFYEVEVLGLDATEVAADTDVLLVLHPQGISDTARYAIDQHVLRGGRTMVFVDPRCEAAAPPPDPQNPFASMNAEIGSSLPDLFAAWGVELVPESLATDRSLGLEVTVRSQRGAPERTVHVAWLELTGEECFDADEVTTAELGRMLVPTAGVLRKAPGGTAEFTPLLSTTENSAPAPAADFAMFPDYKKLYAEFIPHGEELVIAARVSGDANTAFPGGPPEGAASAEHLTSSVSPIHVVLVSDADLLVDEWWIREQTVGPISLGFSKVSDNGDFVLNTVEQLSGNDDLISIRGRKRPDRRFTVVDEIRERTDQDYVAEQERLESRLSEIERDFQAQQQGKSADELFILTPEQERQREEYRTERSETRKQLRALLHNKDEEIDALGLRLKLANVLGVPLLLAVVAGALGALRIRRRAD